LSSIAIDFAITKQEGITYLDRIFSLFTVLLNQGQYGILNTLTSKRIFDSIFKMEKYNVQVTDMLCHNHQNNKKNWQYMSWIAELSNHVHQNHFCIFLNEKIKCDIAKYHLWKFDPDQLNTSLNWGRGEKIIHYIDQFKNATVKPFFCSLFDFANVYFPIDLYYPSNENFYFVKPYFEQYGINFNNVNKKMIADNLNKAYIANGVTKEYKRIIGCLIKHGSLFLSYMDPNQEISSDFLKTYVGLRKKYHLKDFEEGTFLKKLIQKGNNYYNFIDLFFEEIPETMSIQDDQDHTNYFKYMIEKDLKNTQNEPRNNVLHSFLRLIHATIFTKRQANRVNISEHISRQKVIVKIMEQYPFENIKIMLNGKNKDNKTPLDYEQELHKEYSFPFSFKSIFENFISKK